MVQLRSSPTSPSSRNNFQQSLVVVGFVCFTFFMLVNLAIHFVVEQESINEEGDIQIGSVYVSEPAHERFYNKHTKERTGGAQKKQHRAKRKRQTSRNDAPSDEERNTEFLDRLRVPEPRSPSSLPYDVYNCPDEPPPSYPFAWDAVDILSHWNVDSTTIPDDFIYQALCVFDWHDDYDRLQRYREAEVPFVLRRHPQVQATALRWQQTEYLEGLIGDEPQRNEHSLNNHLMYWKIRTPRQKRAFPNFDPPTDDVKISFSEWSAKAQIVQEMPDEVQNDHEHFYFRLNGDVSRQNEYLYDELPFFGIDPVGDFMVNPREQRGINCRFGMKGSIAEAHFDPSRNFIVLLKGQRRYVLAHPSQCRALRLYPFDHPSGRHSAVDWGTEYEQLAGAQVNEVLLQPSDVLYLPTDWFHFIVSLNTNYQCNARSGFTNEYNHYIDTCGL